MNNTHLYERMNNPTVMKGYIHMIKTEKLETVTELYNNITRDASKHPRYAAIMQAYNERVNNL